MRCWRFCWDYKKIVLTVGLRLFQVLHYVFIPMRFVCRSHLTNTKISIDKRRLSHIFVFVAHSPHRNKMNCRNRKNPSNHRFMHLLLIFQFSRKSEETLCDSWVLSTSVCVARSPVDFCSATTEAERRPLVFSVPIPLRTQRAKAPTRRKEFLLICGTKKLEQIFIDE